MRLFAVALAALWVAAPRPVLAGTSGNAIVRNTITVNYNDAFGVAQAKVTASIDLIVSTVSASPAVTFIPGSGSTDGTGSTATYTVRVITNSNGPRLITLSAQDFTASTNMQSKNPADPSGLAASVFLGATIVDPSDTNGTVASWPNGTTLTFAVPNDNGIPTDAAETGGAFNDGVVNGLKAGDTVYLFTDKYYGPLQVGAVSDPAPGTDATVTTSTIQLTNISGAPLANLATSYAQIVEFKDLTMTVTQGTVTDATAYSSWTTTVTATMTGAPATNANVVTVSHMGKIAVAKYVRNVTESTTTGINPYTLTINGATNVYYMGGVGSRPGDVLEYLAVITDTGTGDAQSVTVSDPLPAYSTLLVGANYGVSGGGQVFARARFNGSETNLTTASGGAANLAFGAVSGSPQLLNFWLGTGCAPSTGGTLNSSFETPRTTTTGYLVYQVKIN